MKKILLFALLLPPFMAFAQWVELNQTVTASFFNSCAAYDGKVYCSGGPKTQYVSAASYNNKIEIIDLSNNSVSTAPVTLSAGRAGMMCVAYAGKIYFAGGHKWTSNGIQVFNNIDVYDIATQHITPKHLSVARGVGAAAVVNGKILFIGGTTVTNGAKAPSDVVDIYDPVLDTFTVEHLSLPRSEMGVAVLNNKAYICGGFTNWDFIKCVKRIDIYDGASNNHWSVDSLSSPRTGVSATAVGKYIVVAGGYTDTEGSSDIVDYLNTETGEWKKKLLSIPRSYLTAVAIGNKAYFAGGGHVNLNISYLDATTNRVDIFDATDESITIGPSLNQNRMGHACAAWGNKIAVVSGWQAEQVHTTGSVEVLTVNTTGVSALDGSHIKLEPNPATGSCTIVSSGDNRPDRVEIYSLDGRLQSAQEVFDASGSITLDLTALPDGLYMVEAKNKGRVIGYSKLVVENIH